MRGWKRGAALIFAAGLVLSGCGRDEDGGAGGGEEAKGISEGPATGEITVWAMGAEGEKLPTLAKEFEAANPGVTVKITPVPWDAAHDKIATAIAGRQTPDVSMLGTTWMGEFTKTGALDPTPSEIDKSQFFPGAWDTTVVNGTAYGVPWYVETRLIFYRKDLAEKAGLEPPTSWDSLKAFAEGMQQKAGAKWGIYLQPGGTGSWQTMMPFAWQAGAQEVSDDGKTFTLDSPEMAKALDYYKSFFDAGLSPKAPLQGNALEQGFVNGTIGSFVSGPWHVGLVRDLGGAGFMDKVGLAQMPKEQTGTSFIGGSDLAVFKDSKNRDSAWKFVQFLSQPETQVKWYQTVADLPAVKSGWEDPKLKTDPMLSQFGQQLNDAKAPPAIPTWEQVAAVIDAEIEKSVKAGTSGQDAVKAMQEKASQIGTGA
ncbi:MAG TPA: sugar ABC transporter substrate-binding protein [Mycobacteriales bacterium]|nr:sugar ABC transporter substrate-binding protein [Mycobacteriales bacterium]